METTKNNVYFLSDQVRETEAKKFVLDLHNNGIKFWNVSELNITQKTFECGWRHCEQILQDRIRQALENTVECIYPQDPYSCPDEKRILTDEQIEDIMKRIFN